MGGTAFPTRTPFQRGCRCLKELAKIRVNTWLRIVLRVARPDFDAVGTKAPTFVMPSEGQVYILGNGESTPEKMDTVVLADGLYLIRSLAMRLRCLREFPVPWFSNTDRHTDKNGAKSTHYY